MGSAPGRVRESAHSAAFHCRVIGLLLLLTLFAILIQGYHVGVEDQDVYLAAVNKNLDPSAYPFNAPFFTEQTKLAGFVPAVAATIRLLHSVAWALFLWQVVSIFLILWGCWKLAAACFEGELARWCAVLLVTVLFTIPIAGTALYPLDQYLHPRAPATCGVILALAASLEKRWLRVAAWMCFALLMHPLMALFGASLLLFFSWPAKTALSVPPNGKSATKIAQLAKSATAMGLVLPFYFFHSPSDAWREAAQARTYYFPLLWTWYEWMGLVAPVLLVLWFAHIARRHGMATLELLATRLFAFAIFQFLVGALMTFPSSTEQLTSFQPMRWLHIFYFIFLLMAGGLIGQFLLHGKAWRWLILFLPLAATMFYVQLDSFKYSDHIEWPGRTPKNPWAKAFLWSDLNTPKNAVFAIDPDYMCLHEEDGYGIRALAKRSLLAENKKDPGAATVFPDLAPVWREQVNAQRGIESFDRKRFHDLHTRYGVTWAVLPVTARVPLDCPYRNEAAQVCKVG
jgi:hypothetical protein